MSSEKYIGPDGPGMDHGLANRAIFEHSAFEALGESPYPLISALRNDIAYNAEALASHDPEVLAPAIRAAHGLMCILNGRMHELRDYENFPFSPKELSRGLFHLFWMLNHADIDRIEPGTETATQVAAATLREFNKNERCAAGLLIKEGFRVARGLQTPITLNQLWAPTLTEAIICALAESGQFGGIPEQAEVEVAQVRTQLIELVAITI